MKIGQLSFMYPMIKVTAFSLTAVTFMNRLSVLSANFESTVNDVIGHANFRKIAIFKFIIVISYGENNAYPW